MWPSSAAVRSASRWPGARGCAGCRSPCSSAARSAESAPLASPPGCSPRSPRSSSERPGGGCSSSGCALRVCGRGFAAELEEAAGVEVGLRQSGTLVLARDEDEARALERQLALRESLGLRANAAAAQRRARARAGACADRAAGVGGARGPQRRSAARAWRAARACDRRCAGARAAPWSGSRSRGWRREQMRRTAAHRRFSTHSRPDMRRSGTLGAPGLSPACCSATASA